ncbi:hypothetical protein EV664_102219 [Stakelama pacifica]|uniref:Uncharacterized protein n=1 Tax=Stakelama pacifica TaxID=517720 RepID=A0A4R6FUM6_9SPHN|nr:hypothetical protein EV664_102219 [Stakelama pacifica]|tara:strand:+ start:511 stop:621 length:111 start_codon:yes stop_codon:yes gene_type:complete
MNTQISSLQRNVTAFVGALGVTMLFVIAATPVFPIA